MSSPIVVLSAQEATENPLPSFHVLDQVLQTVGLALLFIILMLKVRFLPFLKTLSKNIATA